MCERDVTEERENECGKCRMGNLSIGKEGCRMSMNEG